MADHSKLMKILGAASMYRQGNGYTMLIDHYDNSEEIIRCVLDDEEYTIRYDEVDLENDVFFKTVVINPGEY